MYAGSGTSGRQADDGMGGDPHDRTMKHSLVLITAGLVLAGAACASDDDAAAPTTTVVAPTTSAPPQTSPSPPPTEEEPTTTPAPPPPSPPTNAARQAQLSGILESHRAAGEFVGARITMHESDGTITEVTSGTQTVDPVSPPVDVDVPWNIGSSTKTFVAVVALQLADEGRLDLDAPIAGFFPDLPDADRITPRQLLQHTSGLGEYLDDPAVQGDLAREWAPAELIAVAEASGRYGEPGGPHRYSNTNYIMLGEIIKQVTGNTWYDEVGTRIAEPLGMTEHRLRRRRHARRLQADRRRLRRLDVRHSPVDRRGHRWPAVHGPRPAAVRRRPA